MLFLFTKCKIKLNAKFANYVQMHVGQKLVGYFVTE